MMRSPDYLMAAKPRAGAAREAESPAPILRPAQTAKSLDSSLELMAAMLLSQSDHPFTEKFPIEKTLRFPRTVASVTASL
jgi:hypothetical protein